MGNRITIYSDKPVAWKALVSQGAMGPVGDASGKADLDDATGLVPMGQLPVTQTGQGGLVAQLDGDGRLMVSRDGVAEYVATGPEMQEAVDALTGGGGVLAKVTATAYAPGTPLALNTDGATYTTIPTIGEYAAASGETYDCFPVVLYSGAGGIKIRRKSNASAVTNLLGFPSFESGAATGWSSSGGVTVTVDNTDARTGTYSLKAVVTATSSGQQVYSPWCAHEQGIKASTAGYVKRITSTSRTVRIDAQYGDAAGNVLASVTGSNNTPGTDWLTRGIMDSAHLGGTGSQTAPSGTTQVRLRFTIVSPSSGDIFRLDDAQVERADTIPAYGSTGGSGGALSCNGLWYPDVPVAQAAGVSPTPSSFATTGSKAIAGFFKVGVTGTGLTGQHIEWEAAVATPGSATSISWAAATFARVGVPA